MPHKISQTIEHGSLTVKVTVRAAVGFDKYTERALFRRIYTAVTGKAYTAEDFNTPTVQALSDYTSLVNRTESVEGLPIPFPTAESDDKELCAGFEYLREIPFLVYDKWLDALLKSDEPPGDPDTQPPDKLSEDKKKPQNHSKA